MSPVVITAAATLAPDEGAPMRELDGLRYGRVESTVRALWPEGPDRLGRMDRFAAHMLWVAHRALAARPHDRAATALLVGTALGCAEVNERYHRGLVERGVEGASPQLFAQTIPSTAAGEVAIALGVKGYTATVMAGRCSGVEALSQAVVALGRGRAARALVLAGDTLGADRVRLRAARGEGPAVECAAALLVEREDVARGEGLAVLEVARVTRREGDVDDGLDRLGASAVFELARWLEGDGDGGVFDAEVRCATGRRGALRATRR